MPLRGGLLSELHQAGDRSGGHLAKAFGTVPHAALLGVLRRSGVPDHCLSIIIRLRDRAKLPAAGFAGEDSAVDVTIGVRRGSCEGPILQRSSSA